MTSDTVSQAAAERSSTSLGTDAGRQRSMEDAEVGGYEPRRAWASALAGLGVVALLYVFLLSISLLGAGFKIFGKDLAQMLIRTTANPFVGLFIGILATSIIQSSSTTTSMIVAFVASGTLTVENAVPIVMGSNIGTTVTCTLVALAHLQRRTEFRRAFAAATVHDFFNLLTVLVLLPLELTTHVLQRTATAVTAALTGSASLGFASPIKVATRPVVELAGRAVAGLSTGLAGAVTVVVALALLFVSLYFLSRMMRVLFLPRIESFFRSTVGRSGVLGIGMGLAITAVVQSSSVTTSLMIPMAAAGAVTLAQIFPIALGANIGTTVTALLASLAGNPAGLTIALVHTLFNIFGVLLIYPLPALRRIPMRLAEALARIGSRSRHVAVLFVLGLFFVLPGLLVLLYRVL